VILISGPFLFHICFIDVLYGTDAASPMAQHKLSLLYREGL
jgi:hypothetical protein